MSRIVSYSLATFKDCVDHDGIKIVGFKIRSTDGTDELYASRRADSKGGAGMTEELIRLSIVSYTVEDKDGKALEIKLASDRPFENFDKWSTKARNFVVAAWKKLATPDELELADFFASATEDA